MFTHLKSTARCAYIWARATWLYYRGNFNPPEFPSPNRIYGAGQTHVWLCPKLLITMASTLQAFRIRYISKWALFTRNLCIAETHKTLYLALFVHTITLTRVPQVHDKNKVRESVLQSAFMIEFKLLQLYQARTGGDATAPQDDYATVTTTTTMMTLYCRYIVTVLKFAYICCCLQTLERI